MTTKQRIKRRLEIEGIAFDNLFEDLIRLVQGNIETRLSRKIDQQLFVEVYNWSDVSVILRNAPVISVTKLERNRFTQANPDWFEIDPDFFAFDPIIGVLKTNDIEDGFQNARVTYTAGWVVEYDSEGIPTVNHTLPFDLVDLAEKLVIRLFKKRKSEGRTTDSFDTTTIEWSALFETGDKEVLANYMRSWAN
ncbi:MAG: hypothetical protein KAS32_00130 [Candidatus Peribacteraceae bacterium]|nr:hypothetical protein [Candidatus Peribacteraceae bacterium]